MNNYERWLKREERISDDLAKCKYKCQNPNCDVTLTIVGNYKICYKCGTTVYSKKGLERLEELKREKFKEEFKKIKEKLENGR